eukprot:jgi/Bigna1/70298/fgenesh1_pg.11_\
MPGDAIKVAVRVRPFNKREKKRNAHLAITMDAESGMVHAKGKVPGGDAYDKKYHFDNAFWSHDGFGTPKFVTQTNLFTTIGESLLKDAWEGYNVCLFAYGQSGAGKSFSMTGAKGMEDGDGIVPRICDGLLRKIAAEPKKEGFEIKLEVSMLEIYIDDLVDLLVAKDKQPKGGIKTYYREVKRGVKVTEIIPLTRVQVKSVEEMEHFLAIGQGNQTIGETGLNAVSSRAHTIFELRITKTVIDKKAGKKETCYNTVRLVDLAGSERLEKTRESKAFNKQREIEGKAINNSLTHLGKVVRRIAELSSKKNLSKAKFKKGMAAISWRSSKLTTLLRDSLGGNCKTVMIAAISPAMTELAETCSTLRYANDIKQISCKAVKAVSKTEQLQKELKSAKDEIAKLRAALAKGGGSIDDGDDEKMEEMKAQLEEMKAKMARESNKVSPEAILQAQIKARKEADAKRKNMPHLEFLHPDPNFSRSTCSFIDKDTVNAGKDDDCGVKLTGLGVLAQHAVFTKSGSEVAVKALSGKELTIVNGNKLKGGQSVTLKPFDRVVMGKKNLFLFRNPEAEKSSLSAEQIEKLIDEHDFDSVKDEMFKDELEAQMKAKREAEARAKAEFERKIREREEKMKAEREKADAERLKMEEEMKKMQAMAGAEKAAAAERMKQLEAAQKRMKAEMKRKEEEHKQAVIDEKRKEENQARQREIVRLSISRLVPLVAEANDIANEFKIAVQYALQAINFPDMHGDIISKVFVQVINRLTGKTRKYVISEETFNEEMFEIRDLFSKFTEKPDEFEMPANNPWIEGMYKPHYLGEARPWIMQIEYGFDVPDEEDPPFVKIIGWKNDNDVIGKLFFKMHPIVPDEIMDKMAMIEPDDDSPEDLSLANVDIDKLDVEMSIDKIEHMPPESCSNVFVTFAIPPNINVAVLNKDVAEDDLDGVFESKICNPDISKPVSKVSIGFNETLRFQNVDKEFFRWLKSQPFGIKVYGACPKVSGEIKVGRILGRKKKEVKQPQENKVSARAPANVGGAGGGDYEAKIKEAMERAAEHERNIKAKEMEVAKLQQEVEKLRSSPGGESGGEISEYKKELAEVKEKNKKLEDELAAKDKELAKKMEELEKARAAANEKSKAGCSLI